MEAHDLELKETLREKNRRDEEERRLAIFTSERVVVSPPVVNGVSDKSGEKLPFQVERDTKKLVNRLFDLARAHRINLTGHERAADHLITLPGSTSQDDLLVQVKNLTKMIFSLEDHHVLVLNKPEIKIEDILSNISLTVQIHELINAVLKINKHESKTDEKYELLREFGQIIKSFKFESDEQRKNSLRNFFYLALQRNQGGLKNTTDSGVEIRRLLNLPEYAPLKVFLFPELAHTPVKYRDLRKFVTGKENNTRT